MRTRTTTGVIASLLMTGAAAAQSAPSQAGTQAIDGAGLFRTYCAACHGTRAKGDGPVAANLRRPPADLTRLAQRNKGTFSREMVYQIIDGRDPVPNHGGGDMPVWGDAFSRVRENASAEDVKARIDALVAFLESIQEGAGR
jgi:mono/diheme cytochrome c family protein